MPLILETDRLILRTVALSDAAASFEIYSDPEVMRYIDNEEPFGSVAEAEAAIARGMSNQEKHGISHWAVVLKSSDLHNLIGHCGFNLYRESNDLELVVHLHREYWGCGYATEAARAAIGYVSDVYSPNRIVGLILPENGGSKRLLKKLKFRLVGEIEEDGLTLIEYELPLIAKDREKEEKKK